MCFKIKIRSLLYYFGIYKNYLRYPETGRFDTKSFRYELKQWNYTKNFDHFKCGLRVNKNDVLDPSFSKQVRGMKLLTNRLNKLVSKRLASRRPGIETTGKRDILASVFPSDTKTYAWDASPR